MAPGAGIRLYVSQNVFSCFAQIQDDCRGPTRRCPSSPSASRTPRATRAWTPSRPSPRSLPPSPRGDLGPLRQRRQRVEPARRAGAPGPIPSRAARRLVPRKRPERHRGRRHRRQLRRGTGPITGEIVWNDIAGTKSATGGGVSSYFPKPAWQTGGTVLAGQSMRCVPDVAAISVANLLNVNLPGFEPYTCDGVGVLIFDGGVSELRMPGRASPARSGPPWPPSSTRRGPRPGRGPIGLLNPHLYPLAGTGAFNDITSGTNGAYAAGPGYNLCTGLGSPNVGNLIAALANPRGAGPSHRLVNISTRAQVETGSNMTIAGFVIQGPAGTQKNVLVRGHRARAGRPRRLRRSRPARPRRLRLRGQRAHRERRRMGQRPAAGNLRRPPPPTGRRPPDDMSSVGAFALAAESADSAMVLSLPPGAYTVQISGQDGASGVGLAEVYELDITAPEVLVNISARCFVGTGSGVAISGFVVEGSQPAQLLITGRWPGAGGIRAHGDPRHAVDRAVTTRAARSSRATPDGATSPSRGPPPVAASFRQATPADMASVGRVRAARRVRRTPPWWSPCPRDPIPPWFQAPGPRPGTGLAEMYELPDP